MHAGGGWAPQCGMASVASQGAAAEERTPFHAPSSSPAGSGSPQGRPANGLAWLLGCQSSLPCCPFGDHHWPLGCFPAGNIARSIGSGCQALSLAAPDALAESSPVGRQGYDITARMLNSADNRTAPRSTRCPNLLIHERQPHGTTRRTMTYPWASIRGTEDEVQRLDLQAA